MGTPRFRSGGRAAVAALAAASCFAVGLRARAADWQISPRIGVSETFTDNVELATGRNADRHSDLVTSIAPGIGIRGTGARTRVNLDYTLTETIFRQVSERDNLQHTLSSSAHTELWERVFFLDAAAAIDRRQVNSGGAISSAPISREINETDVQRFTITPSFRHHFGTWVETLSQISYGQVNTETGEIQDTTTLSETFTASSGRRFTTLLWSLRLNSSKTDNGEEFPASRRRTLDTNYTYVLNSKWSLLAGLGYEDIEERTLTTQPKGLTWNLGFAARPSGRTSVRATYGEREDKESLSFAATHRLSERTSINASYTESIQTTQSLILQDLNLLGFLVSPSTPGVPIDPTDPSTFTLSPVYSPDFGLQNFAFRQKRFSIGGDGTRRRMTYGGSAFWEERLTESTNVTETIYGASLRIGRTLSSRARGSVGVTYRNRDFGDAQDRKDHEISSSVSYTYQIFKDVEATLAYNLTRRITNNADAHLTENAVTLRLSKQF